MKTSLLSLLTLLSISLAAQSPWSRSKAGLFVQTSWNFIPTYTTLFGQDNQDITLTREVSEQSFQLYGEYGLSNKTTLVAAIPLMINRRGDLNPDYTLQFESLDSGSVTGLGNISLAVRHQFLKGKINLAGTLKASLPTKQQSESLGVQTGYDALTVLPMVNIGMGLGQFYWYAYGGYGYRSNDYSHFLNFGAEAGVRLGKIWLGGFSETVYPLENGNRAIPGIDWLTGLYVNDQGWVSIGLKASWEITRSFGINVSGAGAAWAQNVPKSPGIGFGLYYKMGR